MLNARRLNISRAVHFLRSKVCEITISGVGSNGGVAADSESVFCFHEGGKVSIPEKPSNFVHFLRS